jgi:hypothetical protein
MNPPAGTPADAQSKRTGSEFLILADKWDLLAAQAERAAGQLMH